MFKTIILGLIALCVSFNAFATSPIGLKMFNELSIAAGHPGFPVIIEDTDGTYADKYAIHLAKSDIAICKHDPICVAGILAHEFGHVRLRHNYMLETHDRTRERQADLESVRILHAAGYDPCAPIISFNRLKEKYGDISSPEHDKLSNRIKSVERLCRSYKK